jgi:DNA segregation ATPase FtsK/SpoIIIE, S-DNA-T family
VSKILSAGQAVEGVEQLKSSVEAFAARSEKLNEEFRQQSVREQRRCDVTLEAQIRELTATVAEAESMFQAALSAEKARYEQRKSRIGKAYQASKERALQRIEGQLGGRKYDLQKRMLQAERDRESGLTRTTAHINEFRAQLAAIQDELAQLERSAQAAFRGYRALSKGFLLAYQKADINLSGGEDQLLIRLRELVAGVRRDLQKFRGFVLLRVFRLMVVWLLLCGAGLGLLAPQVRPTSLTPAGVMAGCGVAMAVVLGLRFLAARRAAPLAAAISQSLAQARGVHDGCRDRAESHYQSEMERIRGEFKSTTQTAEQELRQANSEAGDHRVACRMKSDERTVRASAKCERLHKAWLERLQREHAEMLQRLQQSGEVRARALRHSADERLAKLKNNHTAGRRALEEEWRDRMAGLFQTIETAQQEALRLFPNWEDPVWNRWTPPKAFHQAVQFARLEVDVHTLCAAVPKDPGLALPGPGQFTLPLCLTYPDQGSVLFETADWGHDQAIGALNNLILRLLSTAPPGRLNFTVIDAVGLGQNFAGVMHLADYEEQIINSRIWTQSTQIEEKLAHLNEHMEKVIQMYLRNEYQTIAEYNEQAGVIAEKYYFLVVADFPAQFTDTAARRLLSIAASGARCGVYMLIHWDRRQPLPDGFIPEELRKSCFGITAVTNGFEVIGRARPGARLALSEPPRPERAIDLVQQIGKRSKDSSRVEVPFAHVAPSDADMWSEETTAELRVPIGRTGATKLQYLAIGKGTRQHGLVAGKTGSGKSTLFHVLITNLALWCSPEQVEFYLVDFKKGVEFKCYASKRLPHARVVAIESDREFGLSVLQRVDDELRHRGDLFRQLGAQDLAGYKRAGGKEKIPRTLLLIDEFQEFFVEDDKIAQTASLLLDRIVRQGRAFGIHVLLGSQTLGGAYTVARTTLGQMVVRIALQCNEADAYLIMDDNNPAPRLLSRPGEGIYNDMAGALEGNSPFQVVWLPDDVRDNYLSKVRARADLQPGAFPGPIVFEGNAPADIRENRLLSHLLAMGVRVPATAGRLWLGAPNSIKGPTEAVFHRQSGNHLLMVGQRDEAVLAMLSVGLVALAAGFTPEGARFILCDATPQGTAPRDYLERVAQVLPQGVTLVKPGDLPEIMKGLATEKARRLEESDPNAATPVFLFIHGLQRFARFRYEEDFGFGSGGEGADANPGAVLNDLICEGARLGFHVIATCDTYNNVSRFLSRKALSEFEMRVLFQMSVNDSASLIDSPKAGMLGLHRALFYNSQEGHLETFRPYALPGLDWVEEAGDQLARSHGRQSSTAGKTA